MTSPVARDTSTGQRRWLPFLLLAVLVGLVPSTAPVRDLTATSYAEIGADEVCWLDSGSCPATYEPPNLLGREAYAAMTPAQAGALHSLEGQAVASVLAAHELPASDRSAVRTWGRTDAQAALWALIVEAIKTPTRERTSVQQLAVGWVTGLVRQLRVSSAEQAGAQYAAWAGLDLHRYWQLVHHTDGVVGLDDAPTQELAQFLSRAPSPYDDPDTAKAKTGFCRFRPPAPYQDDYSASDNSTCYTPCTSPFGCNPDTPDYAQFVAWGAAAAHGQRFTGPEYVAQAWKLTATAYYQATAAGAGIALGAAAAAWLLVSTGTVALGMGAFATGVASTWATVLGLESSGAVSFIFGAGLEASAYATAAAASAAAVVMVVVTGVVTAVLEGIKVDKGAKVPGQIADLVVSTQRASTGDVAALLDTPEGATTIFSLFVNATLPMARGDIACDDTDPQVAAVCLNASPVPDPQASDPQFVVDEKISPTLALAGPTPDLRRTVRVTGDWFVQALGNDRDHPAQTLALVYSDWDGSLQQVWLRRTFAGEYRFLGAALDQAIDPDTCRSEATCWERSSIRYLGADGQQHEARLEVAAAPIGTPTYGATHPVEGQLVTLKANGFAPAHAVGTIRYGWQLQRAGCGVACTTYTNTRAGDTVSHVWQTSGRYEARLTAMDSAGRTATTTVVVPVADVAPVVTDATATSDPSTGQPVTVRARLDHAGTLDNETVHLDWGDGTPSVTSGVGPNVVFMATPDLQVVSTPIGGDPSLATITGTHTYTQPGTYQVRITVIDQAGQTDHLTHTLVVTAGIA